MFAVPGQPWKLIKETFVFFLSTEVNGKPPRNYYQHHTSCLSQEKILEQSFSHFFPIRFILRAIKIDTNFNKREYRLGIWIEQVGASSQFKTVESIWILYKKV